VYSVLPRSPRGTGLLRIIISLDVQVLGVLTDDLGELLVAHVRIGKRRGTSPAEQPAKFAFGGFLIHGDNRL
jgi:hypothetical protein